MTKRLMPLFSDAMLDVTQKLNADFANNETFKRLFHHPPLHSPVHSLAHSSRS